MTPDGILTVRAPSGVTRTSRAPGLQVTGSRLLTRPPAGTHGHPTRRRPATLLTAVCWLVGGSCRRGGEHPPWQLSPCVPV